ncbi:MAG: DUF2219 family protein [Rhodospirillaceae bacterium]|nr:DUF2219 family protein [Rhodospirillaceae bacterium]MBL6930649.1 DUF2219 family protein [Rhodospirillales bacterium]
MRVLILLITAILTVLAFSAQAEPEKASADEGTTTWLPPLLTLQWENDMFAGTDRHYTNGLRLTALFARTNTPTTLEEALQSFSHIDEGGRQPQWFTLGFGQDMFTPGDKKTETLIEGDRPYAGWLYLSASLHKLSTCSSSSDKNPDCLDSVEANVGIVGPSAYGKETQDLVHKARGITRFQGWQNQLKNEPGFVMTWERKKRWISPPKTGWGYDFIPNIGVSLGNVRSQINAGGSMRFGYNIPRDFGAPSAIKPVANLPLLQDNRLGGYFFIGAEGRYVAHNIFLDGNTFAASHSVTRKPWVYDIPLGFVITKGPYRLGLARIYRSREFKGQDKGAKFSSISATVKF